ncbi:MAG: hybrid sensor histidine kinase/response regulator [Anaerolineae bacterium]|nr:hybrid sensor histidine kinase/response regulator [Anaerolineae bacterium]
MALMREPQHHSWAELQRNIALQTGVVLGLVGWYGWYRTLIVPLWDARVVGILLAATAACLVPLLRPRLGGAWAHAIQVAAAATAAYLCYAALGYQVALLFLALPLLQAALTLPLWVPPILALGFSVAVAAGGPRPTETLWAYTVLYLSVTGMGLLVAQSFRGALADSWRHVGVTGDLVREVRARQEEINRLNKALKVSNGLLKRSLSELALATREAEEARHLKEQFATTVSHELRTPLNIILGFVDVMQQYPEVYGEVNWTPLLRRDLGEIQRGARYLSSLVDDILDLARIQALKMPIHREQTDLKALVEEVTALAGRLLLTKPEVRLTSDVPDGLPSLYVDQTRVRQVLLNLLANACRFTAQGEIAVRVELNAEEVVIGVADTGSGIAPEQLDAIFEEFRQEARAMPQGDEGVGKGLGLAIAKRFVQMHGGRIWAESTLGQGSTFYFTLPLMEKRVVSLPAPAGQAEPTIKAEPAVILVDEGEGQAFLARHLEGYQVLAAPDLVTARRLTRERHPRAIILNVPPPAEGATQGPLPPIVPEPVPVLQCSLPTGSWSSERHLFDDWLVKPVTSEKLLGALARFPEARRVFVVDDDRGFVRLVRRILEALPQPYEVAWAHQGEEALALLQEKGRAGSGQGEGSPGSDGGVDVVLLDIALPGLDGRAVARALRKDGGDRCPVLIAVTAVQPGLEGPATSPRAFAVTSSVGFREEDTLELIRACLGRLKPAFALESPGSEPEGEPAETRAW